MSRTQETTSGLLHERISGAVIGSAVRVHRELGPGLLESVYEACLAHELAKAGLRVERQIPVPIVYDGTQLDAGFRIDLFVERAVVVELKAVEQLQRIHEAQLMTYLRLSRIRVGLLINFNVLRLTDGVVRRVL